MVKLHQIEEVDKLLFINSYPIYKLKNGEVFSLEKDLPIKILDKVYEFYVYKDIIFYQENNLNNLYIKDGDKEKEIVGEFSLKGAFYSNDIYSYILGKRNNRKVIYILDYNNFDIIKIIDYNYFPESSMGNYCFYSWNYLVKCFDLLLESEKWQYTLPEGFTIFKQPQIVDDVLFFDSFKNGNEENFVVGLDIKTGKVLWQLLFKIPYKEQLLATTLNVTNNLCYGFWGKKFQIFDPISGDIMKEKIISENINPYCNDIYDDKLWFVSGKYEECKFGYINLANNELEFLQDFPQEDDEMFEVVYFQKKLYLRGVYNNILHIFEE